MGLYWLARAPRLLLLPHALPLPRLTGITSVTITVTVTSIIGRCPPTFYL